MPGMDEHPVLGVLEDMRATVASKAHDYADNTNVYSNFEGAGKIAGVDTEQVFAVMVGIKVERLRQLLSGKEPNHEGIEDTLLDLANYAALWLGYRRHQEGEIMGQLRLRLDAHSIEWYNQVNDFTGVPI